MNQRKNGKIGKISHWSKFLEALFKSEDFEDKKLERDDAGAFYQDFLKIIEPYMNPDTRASLELSEKEIIIPKCRCNEPGKVTRSKQNKFYLQYSGSDDFKDSFSFTEEWRQQFEYEYSCPNCNKQLIKTAYYKKWPKYLFVLATSSMDAARVAMKCPFTVGREIKATYKLVGASIHSNFGAGHYVALVNYGRDWFECDDYTIEKFHDDNRRSWFSSAGIQLMLFERQDS